MAVVISNWLNAVCIYMILFHMIGEVHSKEAKFKVIVGNDVESNAADGAPHISKEFFECGRDQSCTHVVELFEGFVLAHGNIELEKKRYGAVRIYEKVESQGAHIYFVFN